MPGRKKKISIVDVAEVSGVSRSTVSRVINNDPKASASAVKAVRAAMQSLGYEPPPMATRYRRPSRRPQGILTGNIALFFPDVSAAAEHTPLSLSLIHGVSGALSGNDLRMVVAHLPSQNQLPDSIVRKEVDGVIVRGGELSEKLLSKLKNIPTVWLFQRKRRLLWGDQVLPDNQAVGEMAVDYLLAQGCRSLAAVSVQPDHSAFHVRTNSFAALARDTGVKVHLMEEATEIAAMADRLVGADTDIDGLFLPEGDDMLIRLYLALREKGVRLGRDIKAISCNNDYRRLAVLGEDLPNIDIRPEILSQTAVEVLLWRMENPREPIRVVMIAPRLEAGD